MRRPVFLLALLFVTAGCGSKQDAIVRIRVVDLGGSRTLVAVKGAHANGRQVPLASIAPLVPSPLPKAATCKGRAQVVLVFMSGRRVRYGCDLPSSIRTLQEAVSGEARQWAAPPTATTRIAGGTSKERAALRTVLRRLGQTRIRALRLASDLAPVTLHIDAGQTLRGQWEGSLLADMYAGEADRLGLRAVDRVASNGGSWFPRPVGGATIPLSSVQQALAASRAQVVELRHEAGALALTVRTQNPAVFLKRDGHAIVAALRPNMPANYASAYVGVQDRAGALVYAWGWLPSKGMVWARPDLDACGPITHSLPARALQHPCSAS
jgi:hypothetical protein